LSAAPFAYGLIFDSGPLGSVKRLLVFAGGTSGRWHSGLQLVSMRREVKAFRKNEKNAWGHRVRGTGKKGMEQTKLSKLHADEYIEDARARLANPTMTAREKQELPEAVFKSVQIVNKRWAARQRRPLSERQAFQSICRTMEHCGVDQQAHSNPNPSTNKSQRAIRKQLSDD
jgi:hypothetical protein